MFHRNYCDLCIVFKGKSISSESYFMSLKFTEFAFFNITKSIFSLIAEWVERLSPIWGDLGVRTQGIELWSSQTNDINIKICHFPARHPTLLG